MSRRAGAAARETWRAPAKINLWLRITGRRADGYHTIDTGLQAIDLVDTVALEPVSGRGALCRVEGEWAAGVPGGEENLAARAARLMAKRAGRNADVSLSITKAIPYGAGLGGGSSDAAAVLTALARRFGVPASELPALAVRLGADVPFFLAGGTQRAWGIGDLLEPIAPPAERWGVLVYPGVAVSTAWAYGAWDDAGAPAPRPGAGAAAGLPGDWRERGNDFEPVVFARHPEVRRTADLLADGPASLVRMTGSGSAVFALYPDRAARDADHARVTQEARALPGGRAWPFTCIDHGVAPVGVTT